MNPTKPIHCIAEKTGFGRDGDSALQPVRAFAPVAERSAYVPHSFMIQFLGFKQKLARAPSRLKESNSLSILKATTRVSTTTTLIVLASCFHRRGVV